MTLVSTPLDPDDLLAQTLRSVAGDLRSASLGWLFDSRLAPVRVLGNEAALASSLHRLIHGATHLTDGGLPMLDAAGTILRGRLRWHVRIAGTRVTPDGRQLAEWTARLGLHEDGHGPDASLRRAHGRCPQTGAAIAFAARLDQGFLFKFDLVLPIVAGLPASWHSEAAHARAWVVDENEAAGGILAQRLQRIGWATWQFRSVEQARRRLQALDQRQARPALVVAVESVAVTLQDLSELEQALPRESVVALGVMSGSPSLAALTSLDILALPFGTGDLHALTQRSVPAAQTGTGTTEPGPVGLEHRPTLMVVDDDEVSRTLLCGLAHSLGFEVHAVDDGERALQACTRIAFDAAVIDYAMPAINGVDLTQRMRELQHQGRVPPFPIVGASADADGRVQQQWLAVGAAAFLRKPLSREEMQTVLHRLRVRFGVGDA
jgi:CheY-like chemotaxis protein